ncbi:MAG: ATP-binding protein [Acidobacteriia bacterium]|nr:ATP-binding protein [Terriglobia bacterium]
MTNELFENLLYEEEGTGIDFKKEQYRFAEASDEERSELVKDILGFANAWRRTTAYILVGVEEIRGGRSNVIGIPASEQLDDHSLQQFMNYLVNTPVRFNYRAFSYEGKQVGIFVIDEGQQRPIHLTRNYGRLEKDKVYVRRGSSTDPNKPASPTEIAQMGVGRPRDRAKLLVEFAQVDRDDTIGTRLEKTGEHCTMPARKDIPKPADPEQQYPFGISMRDPMRTHNGNYYRELAEYEFLTRLCRAVRITVKNVGEVAANNVRMELAVPMGSGILPLLDLPEKPARKWMMGRPLPHGMRPVFRRDPGDVNIDQNNDRFRIEIDCKDLQPGRRIWSDKFYIGAATTGEYPINGEVLADNLPTPQPFTLT